MLNQIILEGTVANQPELKELPSGTVCSLAIEYKRSYKTPAGDVVEETSVFDAEAYGNLADVCEKCASNGRGVRIVGRLKQSIWNDGVKDNSKVVVVVEHIEFKRGK